MNDREDPAVAATLLRPSASTLVAESDNPPPRDQLAIVDPAAYAVGGEIARGGMGRIRSADDRRLRRTVVIKELIVQDDSLRARFEREAFITARLQHPAIVPIYEAGRWPSGEPFYAMKLVSGRPLDKVIADTKTLAERIALLPRVITVCEAIAFAHQHHVIHRDLKPHNILAGELGETIVIDWGLAKDLRERVADQPGPAGGHAVDQTVAGSVMGTVAYMPPEQARGEPVDFRADVYSLGALLYHLLAGEHPYAGAHPAAGAGIVIHGPPKPLASLVPDVPPDLLAIVDKAMARDKTERYADAAGLVADLSRFQSGQLVGVHRYSFGQLFRRWARRHRTALVVAAAFATVLVIVGVIAIWRVLEANATAEARRRDAEKAQRVAEDNERIATSTSRSLLVEQGRTLLVSGDTQRALVYLNEAYRSGDRSIGLRQTLATAMRDADLLEQSFGPFRSSIVHAGFLSDSKLVLVGYDGIVRITEGGIEVRSFDVGRGTTFLASTARHLAVMEPRDRGNVVAMWDVERGVVLWRGTELIRQVVKHPVTFDRAGKRVVILDDRSPGAPFAQLRDVASGAVLAPLPIEIIPTEEHGDDVHAAFSSSGAFVAVCSGQTIGVWNTTTLAKLSWNAGPCGPVAFVGDRKLLVRDLVTSLHDAVTGKQVAQYAGLVAASHDGTEIAVANKQSLAVHRGTRTVVTVVDRSVDRSIVVDPQPPTFSPDGRDVFVIGTDKLFGWSTDTLAPRYAIDAHREEIRGFAFAASGQRFATIGRSDRTVRVWKARPPEIRHDAADSVLANGAWVAVSDDLAILRSDTGEQTRRLPLVPDHKPSMHIATTISASRNGERVVIVASTADTCRARVLDPASTAAPIDLGRPEPLVEMEAGSGFELICGVAASLSDDGRFAVVTTPTQIQVFDTRGSLVRAWNHKAERYINAAISAAGERVVVVHDDTIRFLDVASGTDLPGKPLTKGFYHQPKFNPTDQTGAIWSDHIVLRFDAATGDVRQLFASTDNINTLEFSADGRRIVSRNRSATVQLWAAQTGASLATFADCEAFAISADGERIATGNRVAVTLWDTSGRKLTSFDIATDTAELDGYHRLAIDRLQFSADGRRLLIQHHFGTAVLADVHLETRSPDEIAPIVERFTRWKLVGGVLTAK